jgi:hypothetical protein
MMDDFHIMAFDKTRVLQIDCYHVEWEHQRETNLMDDFGRYILNATSLEGHMVAIRAFKDLNLSLEIFTWSYTMQQGASKSAHTT